ncbi:hypothetical protein [Anaerococcus sp. mt242]|uniref:hypothetical protein n=1 Tax=unclassified Anaerococcus TaxID=2614126 RepID=UPI0019326310|nr:hypothetical protein [Anaerococcus sp. mt242]MBM0046133.1 hypothetical protein [Anaerococcus sp. mt242]
MALTHEQAQANLDKKAVLALRSVEGTTVNESLLEDPAMFDQLVDLGLIEIPEDTLTIGEVLGAETKGLVEGLTAITPDLVDTSKVVSAVEETSQEVSNEEALAATSSEDVDISFDFSETSSNGFVISIEEGRDIRLEFEF